MNKISLSVEAATELRKHIGKAGTVTPVVGDDPQTLRKYRYACGRNYDRLGQLIAPHDRVVFDIKNPPDEEWDEYVQAHNGLLVAYEDPASKEEHAQHQKANPGRADEVIIDPARADQYEAELQKLLEKYALAIERKKLRDQQGEEYKKTTMIDVELYTTPYDTIPLGLIASYYTLISPMLTGLPEST